MNAGAHGGEIGPFVRSVTLIDRTLNIVTRPRDQCGFEYRTSGFQPGEILTGATLASQGSDWAGLPPYIDRARPLFVALRLVSFARRKVVASGQDRRKLRILGLFSPPRQRTSHTDWHPL